MLYYTFLLLQAIAFICLLAGTITVNNKKHLIPLFFSFSLALVLAFSSASITIPNAGNDALQYTNSYNDTRYGNQTITDYHYSRETCTVCTYKDTNLMYLNSGLAFFSMALIFATILINRGQTIA